MSNNVSEKDTGHFTDWVLSDITFPNLLDYIERMKKRLCNDPDPVKTRIVFDSLLESVKELKEKFELTGNDLGKNKE